MIRVKVVSVASPPLDSGRITMPIITEVCPFCQSAKVVKNGWTSMKIDARQRYKCKKCGRRYQERLPVNGIAAKLWDVVPRFEHVAEIDVLKTDAVVWMRWFSGQWSWYTLAMSPWNSTDVMFLGWVDGVQQEFGTFFLSELRSYRAVNDLLFQPCNLSEIITRARSVYL